jgi:hypothetical protein
LLSRVGRSADRHTCDGPIARSHDSLSYMWAVPRSRRPFGAFTRLRRLETSA